MLYPHKQAVTNRDYQGDRHFMHPKAGFKFNMRLKQIIARHENINRRVKSFACLSEIFCYDLSLYYVFFQVVINIVQVSIEEGDKLPNIISQGKVRSRFSRGTR